MNEPLETLRRETADLTAGQLVAWAVGRYGDRAALATSFGAEDQVLTDLLCRAAPHPRVFTLDTGRLPQETYDCWQATQRRYGLTIAAYFPAAGDVEALVREGGPNGFYDSLEARKRCCHVRKVLPLRRALTGLAAWMTGLRREQSVTRADLQRVDWDAANGLLRLSPLADWTSERVWEYLRAHDVPVHALHARGYPSLGCAPCTRAVAPGEDPRGGRWWWESPQHKECGLHVVDGRPVRQRRD